MPTRFGLATREVDGGIEITLKLAPLPELFPQLEINQVFDLVSVTDGNGLALSRAVFDPTMAVMLPEEIVAGETRASESTHGGERSRAAHGAAQPFALRYYDEARDYQIAVQRALGTLSNGQERTIDFPAALTAEDARKLSLTMAQQARWRKDQMNWRIAELDPELAPGRIVRIKDHPGYWIISSWEWLDRGVQMAYSAKLSAESMDWATLRLDSYPGEFNWISAAQIVREKANYGSNDAIDVSRLLDRAGALKSNTQSAQREYIRWSISAQS